MGNDDRYGGDRWQGREPGREQGRDGWNEGGRNRGHRDAGDGSRGWNEGRREEAGWGPGLGDGNRGGRGRDEHDGGNFFERASEAARSWLGGGDDDDGRDRGSRGGRGGSDRERGPGSHRDNGFGESAGAGTLGGGGFGGGWGNQDGQSWNRDRPGRPGWFTDSVGGERGRRPGAGGGDGHYGAHGAGGSFAEHQRSGGGSPEQARGGGTGGQGGYTPMTGDYGRGGLHDPHYSQWRQRQIEEIDRDYEEYRREHQSKFESEFGNWRSKRQGQRQLMNRVTEQMEVLGSDGAHIGTVDKVRGDRIILTKSDPNAGGAHHSVPCSWVENVEEKVTLNRTAEQAMNEWRDEERSRALFEKPDQGSEGPHVLGRSFSGTYRDRDEE
jgi:hypothetical protein